MAQKSVHDLIRKAEVNFLSGNTKQGKYVNWSMHDTIETIDAYLNSKHISGPTDSLGREKPFFNIVTAATNIWYRATEIDRKDIRFVPQNSSSVVLAFIANVLLQQWMDKNRFGVFLKQWGRTLVRYGSAVSEFVEKDGDLVCSVIPWNRVIPDTIDFQALPVIKKLYLTPSQLRKNKLYDKKAVDSLINAINTRRTLDKMVQDTKNDFIEVYEVHGELDSRLIEDKPNWNIDDSDAIYTQQMHVVSFVQQREGEYADFCLYKGREAKSPYQKDDLIEEDGRSLAIGAVEYLFDAQWMSNHTIKNMKDTLDLASKLIFQTADKNFANRNVLSSIESGDILYHEDNKPLERLANDKPDIQAMQSFYGMWNEMAQQLTSTPDAMRGIVSGGGGPKPYALQALLTQQASNLFEVMTENKGLAIEDMLRTFVIPHLKKQLKHKDEVAAILDDAGIKEIDSMYVPREAIRRYNARTTKQVFDNVDSLVANKPTQPLQPYNPQQEQASVQQELAPLGNKRFLTPDDIDKKTWADLFSDFQWDNIKVEVTNENVDKQQIMQTLTMVLQSLASNPMILQDPNAKMVFSKILEETGVLSPLQLSTAAATPSPLQAQPQPQPQTQPGAPGGGGGLPTNPMNNGTGQ